MSLNLAVTNHAVKAYREYASGDSSRKGRSDEEIREIILGSLAGTRCLQGIEELFEKGGGINVRATVSLCDCHQRDLGKYVIAVKGPRHGREGYAITTIYEKKKSE